MRGLVLRPCASTPLYELCGSYELQELNRGASVASPRSNKNTNPKPKDMEKGMLGQGSERKIMLHLLKASQPTGGHWTQHAQPITSQPARACETVLPPPPKTRVSVTQVLTFAYGRPRVVSNSFIISTFTVSFVSRQKHVTK